MKAAGDQDRAPKHENGQSAAVLHVPARDIPVPDSVSPQAQAALAMTFAHRETEYPPLDDKDAWRRLVTTQDEASVALMAHAAEEADAIGKSIEIDGVPVHDVSPCDSDDDRVVLRLHVGALIFFGGKGSGILAVLDSVRLGLRTWGVDYRMPPDDPYPAGLNDCVVVYRRLVEEVGAERVIVAGCSSGGNLAAALVIRARDEGLPLPGAVVLETPEVDLTESGDTFQTNLGIDTVLGTLLTVNKLYANGYDLADPYLSPLFANLTGFPPTILTSGTRDLFLSNTVRMHRALRRAGVKADLHVLEAAPHAGFMQSAPEDAELNDEIRRFIDRHCPPRHRGDGEG